MIRRSHLWKSLFVFLAIVNFANLCACYAIGLWASEWWHRAAFPTLGSSGAPLFAAVLSLLVFIVVFPTLWVSALLFIFGPAIEWCELRRQWALLREVYAKELSPGTKLILYLRPFAWDRLTQWAGKVYVERFGMSAPAHWSHVDRQLDNLLSAITPHGEVVLVPTDSITRLPEWTSVVNALVARANAIVMVAGPSDGILRELKFVLDDCRNIKKTVFVKAEHVEEREWEVIRAHACEMGVVFPRHYSDGMLFTFDTEKCVRDIVRLSLSDPPDLSNKFAKILVGLLGVVRRGALSAA
ncbi:MAG TPA: hypothetical protein VGP76_29415 [Planctomycetaceae bacterium]|jgi:hypothetical protein|nr:hypothetical protein [Planctomycetaceae bacterium]HEV8071869.1 hypothetical protein [Planctomycetaceae bacterium]